MAEKTLRDVGPELRGFFLKGNEALQRRNYDYAITLFQQVLAREPGFFECRQALRAAQITKQGGSTGFFRKAFGGVSSSPLLAKAQLSLNSNPLESLNAAEHALSSDPNSTPAQRLLGDAALALQMPRTAVMAFEMALKNSPNHKSTILKLVEALTMLGDNTRAEKLLGELSRAYPGDMELAQAYKNLTAHKTMSEGGYEKLADGTGTFRDALRDKEEAVSLEQEARAVKAEDVAERLIREYEERLQREPNNLKLLRNIAELHAQKKRFDEALQYYERLRASESGADPTLERTIADTVGKKFDHAIAQIDPNAADYSDQLARLQGEKQAFLIEECRKRVEKYPTDLGIRFEMGLLYFQAGKIGEAIQEFQKAQGNPHRRIQAMHYLGQCFARRGINDLAARTFQNAIKEKPVFDDEKKELIYAFATVLEKMGKREEAIEQFKLIYEVDIGYKDVSAKIDAFYAGQA